MFYTGAFLSLLFVTRLLLAPFSKKISQQIRQYPKRHFWLGVTTVGYGVFFFFLLFIPEMSTPHWIEVRNQRRIVSGRIQAAGGWATLAIDCNRLAEMNSDQGFAWFGASSNALPAAIALLEPRHVRYFSSKYPEPNSPPLDVVEIKIFGGHATGGHSTPYYGLYVVCATNEPIYTPPISRTASGNSHYHSRKVARNIYEVY